MTTQISDDDHRAAHMLAGAGWRPERIAPVMRLSVRTVYRMLAAYRRAEAQRERDRAECDRDRLAYARELAG